MKNDVSNSHSLAMNNSSCSTIINDDAKLTEQNANNIPFINQGAISWNQMRREWVGDRSKRPHRAPREPTISWCATYEDLFSTNQPFSQPIPLSGHVVARWLLRLLIWGHGKHRFQMKMLRASINPLSCTRGKPIDEFVGY
ncbi:unnamed protein product [Musa textilis]